MVQREVGERLAASPGSGAYGTPSVLAQLACEVEVLRAIPRTVFVPVPNVDSVLVGLCAAARRPRRRAERRVRRRCARSWRRASPIGARPLVGLARALRRRARALPRGGARRRSSARQPADVRAERLAPEDFRALARLLEL